MSRLPAAVAVWIRMSVGTAERLASPAKQQQDRGVAPPEPGSNVVQRQPRAVKTHCLVLLGFGHAGHATRQAGVQREPVDRRACNTKACGEDPGGFACLVRREDHFPILVGEAAIERVDAGLLSGFGCARSPFRLGGASERREVEP